MRTQKIGILDLERMNRWGVRSKWRRGPYPESRNSVQIYQPARHSAATLASKFSHDLLWHDIGDGNMALPDMRVQVILAELAKHGRVSVKDISHRLDVSRETIRRDLKILEREGHLRCVYGGGVKPVVGLDQPAAERMRINAREKGRLAIHAAKLVKSGSKIFVDSGTTTLAFARHLINIEGLNIFTNSLDIAQLFDTGYSGSVTVVGGTLNPSYRALFGPSTLEAIKGHLFDIAFVSIAAVDYTYGFMDYGEDEAAVRRELRARSRHYVMLADSNKFGRSGNIRTLELKDIDTLVTDAQPRADFSEKLKEAQVEVIYA